MVNVLAFLVVFLFVRRLNKGYPESPRKYYINIGWGGDQYQDLLAEAVDIV